MSNCVNIDLDKSLIVQIYDLQQQNKKYEEVIDKAIEYIEYVSIDETYSNVLLEILKGDSNE